MYRVLQDALTPEEEAARKGAAVAKRSHGMRIQTEKDREQSLLVAADEEQREMAQRRAQTQQQQPASSPPRMAIPSAPPSASLNPPASNGHSNSNGGPATQPTAQLFTWLPSLASPASSSALSSSAATGGGFHGGGGSAAAAKKRKATGAEGGNISASSPRGLSSISSRMIASSPLSGKGGGLGIISPRRYVKPSTAATASTNDGHSPRTPSTHGKASLESPLPLPAPPLPPAGGVSSSQCRVRALTPPVNTAVVAGSFSTPPAAFAAAVGGVVDNAASVPATPPLPMVRASVLSASTSAAAGVGGGGGGMMVMTGTATATPTPHHLIGLSRSSLHHPNNTTAATAESGTALGGSRSQAANHFYDDGHQRHLQSVRLRTINEFENFITKYCDPLDAATVGGGGGGGGKRLAIGNTTLGSGALLAAAAERRHKGSNKGKKRGPTTTAGEMSATTTAALSVVSPSAEEKGERSSSGGAHGQGKSSEEIGSGTPNAPFLAVAATQLGGTTAPQLTVGAGTLLSSDVFDRVSALAANYGKVVDDLGVAYPALATVLAKVKKFHRELIMMGRDCQEVAAHHVLAADEKINAEIRNYCQPKLVTLMHDRRLMLKKIVALEDEIKSLKSSRDGDLLTAQQNVKVALEKLAKEDELVSAQRSLTSRAFKTNTQLMARVYELCHHIRQSGLRVPGEEEFFSNQAEDNNPHFHTKDVLLQDILFGKPDALVPSLLMDVDGGGDGGMVSAGDGGVALRKRRSTTNGGAGGTNNIKANDDLTPAQQQSLAILKQYAVEKALRQREYEKELLGLGEGGAMPPNGRPLPDALAVLPPIVDRRGRAIGGAVGGGADPTSSIQRIVAGGGGDITSSTYTNDTSEQDRLMMQKMLISAATEANTAAKWQISHQNAEIDKLKTENTNLRDKIAELQSHLSDHNSTVYKQQRQQQVQLQQQARWLAANAQAIQTLQQQQGIGAASPLSLSSPPSAVAAAAGRLQAASTLLLGDVLLANNNTNNPNAFNSHGTAAAGANKSGLLLLGSGANNGASASNGVGLFSSPAANEMIAAGSWRGGDLSGLDTDSNALSFGPVGRGGGGGGAAPSPSLQPKSAGGSAPQHECLTSAQASVTNAELIRDQATRSEAEGGEQQSAILSTGTGSAVVVASAAATALLAGGKKNSVANSLATSTALSVGGGGGGYQTGNRSATPRPVLPFQVQTQLGVLLKSRPTSEIVAELATVALNLKSELDDISMSRRKLLSNQNFIDSIAFPPTTMVAGVEGTDPVFIETISETEWPSIPHFLRTRVTPHVTNSFWTSAFTTSIVKKFLEGYDGYRARAAYRRDFKMLAPRMVPIQDRRKHVLLRLDATEEDIRMALQSMAPSPTAATGASSGPATAAPADPNYTPLGYIPNNNTPSPTAGMGYEAIPFGYVVTTFFLYEMQETLMKHKLIPSGNRAQFVHQGDDNVVELELAKLSYNFWFSVRKYRHCEPLCDLFVQVSEGQIPRQVYDCTKNALSVLRWRVTAQDSTASAATGANASVSFNQISAAVLSAMAEQPSNNWRSVLYAVNHTFRDNGVAVHGKIPLDLLFAGEAVKEKWTLGSENLGSSFFVKAVQRMVINKFNDFYAILEALLLPYVRESTLVPGLSLIRVPDVIKMLKKFDFEYNNREMGEELNYALCVEAQKHKGSAARPTGAEGLAPHEVALLPPSKNDRESHLDHLEKKRKRLEEQARQLRLKEERERLGASVRGGGGDVGGGSGKLSISGISTRPESSVGGGGGGSDGSGAASAALTPSSAFAAMDRLIAGKGATDQRLKDLEYKRRLAEEKGPAPLHALSKYLQPVEGRGGEGVPTVLTLPHQRMRTGGSSASGVDPQALGIYTSFGGSNAYIPVNGFFLCSFAKTFVDVASELPRMNYSVHFKASAEAAAAEIAAKARREEEAVTAADAAALARQQQQEATAAMAAGNGSISSSGVSTKASGGSNSQSRNGSRVLLSSPLSPPSRRGTLAPAPPPPDSGSSATHGAGGDNGSTVGTPLAGRKSITFAPSSHGGSVSLAPPPPLPQPSPPAHNASSAMSSTTLPVFPSATNAATASASSSSSPRKSKHLGTAAFALSVHDNELVEWYQLISALRTYGGPIDVAAAMLAGMASASASSHQTANAASTNTTTTSNNSGSSASDAVAVAAAAGSSASLSVPRRPFMCDLLFRSVAELRALAASSSAPLTAASASSQHAAMHEAMRRNVGTLSGVPSTTVTTPFVSSSLSGVNVSPTRAAATTNGADRRGRPQQPLLQ